jgi:predicted lipid-binding transport protein (Tim44 family)
MRGLLVALGALLGIVLLTQGFVVIGGILLVMAVVRVVMIVRMRKFRAQRLERRQQFVAQMRQRRGLGS